MPTKNQKQFIAGAICALSIQVPVWGQSNPATNNMASFATGFTHTAATAQSNKVGAGIDTVGGTPTPVEARPWLVAVVETWNNDNYARFKCGATLLSSTWAVTAAHCVNQYEKKEKDIALVAGIISLKDKSAKRTNIVKIFLYKSWNPDTKDSDIALLKIEPITLGPKVRPVAYLRSAQGGLAKIGAEITVTGWGATTTGVAYDVISNDGNVSIVSSDACQQSDKEKKITINMICAIGKNKNQTIVDTCQGDSGGPAVLNASSASPILAGITSDSTGKSCGQPGHYGIYTRISNFAPWIDETIKANTP